MGASDWVLGLFIDNFYLVSSCEYLEESESCAYRKITIPIHLCTYQSQKSHQQKRYIRCVLNRAVYTMNDRSWTSPVGEGIVLVRVASKMFYVIIFANLIASLGRGELHPVITTHPWTFLKNKVRNPYSLPSGR